MTAAGFAGERGGKKRRRFWACVVTRRSPTRWRGPAGQVRWGDVRHLDRASQAASGRGRGRTRRRAVEPHRPGLHHRGDVLDLGVASDGRPRDPGCRPTPAGGRRDHPVAGEQWPAGSRRVGDHPAATMSRTGTASGRCPLSKRVRWSRVRCAGAVGIQSRMRRPVSLGFYVLDDRRSRACRQTVMRSFSFVMRQHARLRNVIEAIPEQDCRPSATVVVR